MQIEHVDHFVHLVKRYVHFQVDIPLTDLFIVGYRSVLGNISLHATVFLSRLLLIIMTKNKKKAKAKTKAKANTNAPQSTALPSAQNSTPEALQNTEQQEGEEKKGLSLPPVVLLLTPK
jgi:hypothetical protein